MMRVIAALPLMLLFAACAQIGPRDSITDEEIVVTGVAVIDANFERPIRSEQIYPQVRLKAYEDVLGDARLRMLARISSEEIAYGVHLGEMMTQHPRVRRRAEKFVGTLLYDAPRWHWEEGFVEIDQRVSGEALEEFVASLPQRYLLYSLPGDGSPPPDLVAYLPEPEEPLAPLEVEGELGMPLSLIPSTDPTTGPDTDPATQPMAAPSAPEPESPKE